MKIEYLGHSAFQITTEEGMKVLIDPFISGNPVCTKEVETLNPDIILVTHGHVDHFGDTLEIANNSGATVIATHEIATFIQKQGLNAIGMNIGGTVSVNDLISVTMTDARHSSGMDFLEDMEEGGVATGFVITLENGKKIYHAGDTGLFGDMKMVIGDIYQPDIALLPIGDKFTMGIEDAAVATAWLQSRIVIPMHYNTFEAIEQDANLFAQYVEDASLGTFTVILQPGEDYEEK
ncbi:MAG: metal-dependent hydrolase [Methanosphaera sp. rholeuAM6]|nr:MAG: metal-dependent hydrolase [Methanosphaera sp. rholeuAM6]